MWTSYVWLWHEQVIPVFPCEFPLLLTEWSEGISFNQVIQSGVVLCEQGSLFPAVTCVCDLVMKSFNPFLLLLHRL